MSIDGAVPQGIPGMMPTKKSHCPYFVAMPTNPDVCAKWIRPVHAEPFCQVEEKCESMGLRLVPRADQEDDSFE